MDGALPLGRSRPAAPARTTPCGLSQTPSRPSGTRRRSSSKSKRTGRGATGSIRQTVPSRPVVRSRHTDAGVPSCRSYASTAPSTAAGPRESTSSMNLSIRALTSSGWSICGPWPVAATISARAPGMTHGHLGRWCGSHRRGGTRRGGAVLHSRGHPTRAGGTLVVGPYFRTALSAADSACHRPVPRVERALRRSPALLPQ